MRKGVWLCCVGLLVGQSIGADSPQRQPWERTMTTMTTMARLFRMEASENVEQAIRHWGTREFALQWEQQIMALFEKEELIEWQDFFSSAVIWGGRVSAQEGVTALYSPWSDGLLLLHVHVDGENSRLTDFRLISGEALRGDVLPKEPSLAEALPLVAGRDLPTLTLARLYAGSLKAFNAHYPLDGEPSLKPAGFANEAGSNSEETALIKTRMLQRMSMFKDFFGKAENRLFVAETGHLLKALAAERPEAALARLSPDQPVEIVETVFEMPEVVRTGFAPNFFGTRDKAALVGLVSPQAPKWILMVLIENKPGQRPSLTMEVLDLGASALVVEQADKEAK